MNKLPLTLFGNLLEEYEYHRVGQFVLLPPLNDTTQKIDVVFDIQWFANGPKPDNAELIWVVSDNTNAALIWSGVTSAGAINRIAALKGGWNGPTHLIGYRQRKCINHYIREGLAVNFYERELIGDDNRFNLFLNEKNKKPPVNIIKDGDEIPIF